MGWGEGVKTRLMHWHCDDWFGLYWFWPFVQSLSPGFKAVLEAITEAGFERVQWVCMRTDPVIYVLNNPYSPRDR